MLLCWPRCVHVRDSVRVSTPHPQQLQRIPQHRTKAVCRCSAHQQGQPPEPASTVPKSDAVPPAAQEQQQAPAGDGVRGPDYFAGLVSSDITRTNDSTPADMLARSLQLAGGAAALLALLTYGFLAANGLV